LDTFQNIRRENYAERFIGLTRSLLLPAVISGCCATLSFAQENALDNVLSKSSWGGHSVKTVGRIAKQYKGIGDVKYVSIHYTGSRPRHSTYSEKELLRFVQEGHQNTHNFGDIAYHYLVGFSGNTYKGREDTIAPATHTHYYNEGDLTNARHNKFGQLIKASVPPKSLPGHTEGHITVTFIVGVGSPQILPDETMEKGAKLIAALLNKHNLDPSDVRAHREIALTKCPGDETYRWLRGDEMQPNTEGIGMKLIRAEFEKLQ